MYYVYAIYNELVDKIYIGQTSNFDIRLNQHDEKSGLSKFTTKFKGRWKIVYKEEIDTRTNALKREKQLKSSRGRAFIRSLL